jgi:hypothetical protein
VNEYEKIVEYHETLLHKEMGGKAKGKLKEEFDFKEVI